MEATFQITKFTKEDLVNLFSTATYGNNYLEVSVPKEYEHFKTEDQCLEDYWATVLLNGGELEIGDLNDDCLTKDDASYYGKQGINWVSTDFKVFTNKLIDPFGMVLMKSTFGVPIYRINLDTLIKGLNSNQVESPHYITEMFIEGDGDFYTAYNILQIAIFGEVIYG